MPSSGGSRNYPEAVLKIDFFKSPGIFKEEGTLGLPPVKTDMNTFDSSIFTADAQLPPCL